ncbi:DUF123 domain-containing protein [Chloroflexota bacterium]
MTKIENGITLSKNDSVSEGKGSYILLVELPEEQTIVIGSLKAVHFHRGHYAYVGSAMGGFKSRLNRHLRVNKRPRWHIDYLLQKASINNIILCETKDTIECTIAQALSSRFYAIPSFGSSDCKCHSHLFFATGGKKMKSRVMSVTRLSTPEGTQVVRRKGQG